MRRCAISLCYSLFYLFIIIGMFAPQAIADPVIVAQTGANSDLSNSRQIVRTSTGRIYYLSGNAGRTANWDGWLEVHASGDGSSWNKESSRDQWYLSSDIGVSIDSKNVLHVISYDWNHHPYYVRYNTADSPTASLAWDGYETLETAKASDVGRCAMAVDANGNPHVVYQSLESYKGKTYYTLTYANRVGSVWSKVAVWPVTLKTSFSGKIDIAIGRDNIPYILTGNKILKGNANAATSFETKDLGSAGTSFVIQQNGDIKVAQISNGKYAINSHGFTLPWSSGWSLAESTTPDSGSTLLLANDTLYAARLKSDGIWLQKYLDPPFLAAAQPANTTWQSLTARWSSYNHSKQGIIDLGTRSWDQQNGNLIWYSANLADSAANFYGGPFSGVAPLKVSLLDSSIPREGSDITSWQWDFDNDGTADVSGPNATHIYTVPGKYSVSLAITDSSGGQDKIVIPNLVNVDGDSDGDGIPDSRDNCPNDYNPLQIDLNGNGIGDACEAPINRLAKAMFMTGLRSITAADSRKATDVTAIMTDGLLDQKVTLLPASNDALTIQVNKDAAAIKKLGLRFYLGINGNPLNTRVYIMTYNRDLTTTVDAGLSGGWSGWNEVDLTSILHRMDGFGQTQFRLVALNDPNGVNISEINIIEKADLKEIAVAPEVVDFGAVSVAKGTVQSITVSNTGAESLNIVKTHPPSQPFSIVSDGCSGKALAQYASCIITVSLAPVTDGKFNDVIVIDSNDGDLSSKRINLQGTGILALTGTVIDGKTGLPLNNVKVEVTDSSRTFTTATDLKGEYTVTGVAAGSYVAKFSRFDYDPYSINGTIDNAPMNKADIKLYAGISSFVGIFTDSASGTPLSGVKITIAKSKATEENSIETRLSAYFVQGSLPADDRDITPYPPILIPEELRINDEQKIATIHHWFDDGYVIHQFKTRNPFNTPDPFKITWNGLAAAANDPNSPELFAQSFTPGVDGPLTKVSLQIGPEKTPTYLANVFVYVKSALGSEVGAVLATSLPVSTTDMLGKVWVDFVFPAPAQLQKGQQYYLEVYKPDDVLEPLTWGFASPNPYSGGKGYCRHNGIWQDFNYDAPYGGGYFSWAFITYMDNIQDQKQETVSYGGNVVKMKGKKYRSVKMEVFNQNTKYWEQIASDTSGGGYDDVTLESAIKLNPEFYYSPDGWISTRFFGYELEFQSLASDMFKIEFIDVRKGVSASDGSFNITSLNQGEYELTFERPGYETVSTTSILASTQQVLNVQLKARPPAALSGIVTTSGIYGGLANVLVTVTDALDIVHTTVTDASGKYFITGLPDGAYSVAYQLSGYDKRVGMGTLVSGQTTTSTIYLIRSLVGSITGRIVDSVTDLPIQSATVTITDAQNITQSVATDANGQYSINNIASGAVSVTITKAGYTSYSVVVTIAIAQQLTVNGALNPLTPVMSSITASPLAAYSVAISWMTDQQATSKIEYGETTSYGSSASDGAFAINHSLILTGLKPGTTYHYRVASTNGYNITTTSVDKTFVTPLFSVKNLNDSGNITLMEVSGNYDAKKSDGSVNDLPRQTISQEYFKTHPDKDFLVFFSTFDYAMPEAGAQGFYSEVKNDTQGINRTMLDNSTQFGSAGMLQGTIDMGNITALAANPYGPKLDEMLTVLNHEIGHRWGSYVRFNNPDGSLNSALLGKDSAHWSYLLDSKGSLLYGNGWKDNGNGTFTSVSKQSGYSPLDLYLMGMIPKEQVPPMLLIENPAIDKTKLPYLGDMISGTAKTVTINDIIAAEGARVPNAAASQKQFNVGFVLLTRAGDNATAATQAIETLRKAWAGRFAELTQGKGSVANIPASLELAIESPADGTTITGPDVTVSGTVINTSGEETGVTVNGMPATVNGSRFIVNHVPLTEGNNSITITATDADGLTATTSRSITAQAGNYIRINSNIDSGTGPLNVSLRLDGSFTVTNPTINVQGPVGVAVQQDTQSGTYTATLSIEGIYTVTAGATGPDGQAYIDSVTITVVPRYQLETLLKGKWEGMKAKIAAGDIQSAETYFPSASRQMFQSLFGDVNINGLARLNEVREVEIYSGAGNYAQGGLIRQDDDGVFSYPMTYSKDELGIWRIYNF